MTIEVDRESGFCPGVVAAIQKAERHIAAAGSLYCLGDIVHNSQEVQRLEAMGLTTIGHDDMARLADTKVLLRAHGEPPSTYALARERGIEIIDATCPVVLQLQKKIKRVYEADRADAAGSTPQPAGQDAPQKAWGAQPVRQGTAQQDQRSRQAGQGPAQDNRAPRLAGQDAKSRQPGAVQIVIYGKMGHAEVNGLVGQTEGTAIVIEHPEDDLSQIDFTRPVRLFSQTTMEVDKFRALAREIESRMARPGDFEWQDTICRQVANRIPHLQDFAARHDVILFVSGKKSSNGKALFGVCQQAGRRSYLVSTPDEVTPAMLTGAQSVGICGATSTPKWQMEQVAERVAQMCS